MGRRYPRRSQLKYTKQRYRVRNWPEYEAGLRNRGDLTLWFSEEAIAAWRAPIGKKPGGQPVYSDLAIEAALTVRLVFGLALRQTEGFLRSVSALLNLELRIPDHSTLSRRSKGLNVPICPSARKGPVDIIIDSTGLRVHSGNGSDAGPPPKRRTWRKLHVVVNADTGEVLASTLTTHRARDSAQVPGLLTQINDQLASALADGAYDTAPVYNTIAAHGSDLPTRVLIPPRRDAKIRLKANDVASQRNATIRAIDAGGRRRWEHESGYTRRSLVETTMSRYKAIFGVSMRSRTIATQKVEATLACAILNRMTHLGMPDGNCVT
ncbi:MAG: IS5 family transposase [Gammaproteobacteria bacterium]|nr:IS5 family transposase [Gammaproteobacteria bacterium]